MKVVACGTIFSLVFLSFHVAVDHAWVDSAGTEKVHWHGHYHSHADAHSHHHGASHHPSSDSDTAPNNDSSHDPLDHEHDGTTLRTSNIQGDSFGLNLVCTGPQHEPSVVQSLSTTITPTLGLPPPPEGKTFLRVQSLLI